MSRKHFLSIILFICNFLLTYVPLAAQEEGEIIIISERVGEEIDQAERDQYKLFQDIEGFQSAVFIRLPDNRYILKIAYKGEQTGELKIDRIPHSIESINKYKYHIDYFGEIQERRFDEIQAYQDTVYQAPGTAFFVELIGKPYSSINIDFRISKWSRFSLGIMAYYEIADEEKREDEVTSFLPNIMYYLLGGEKNSRFEIGAGFGLRPVWNKDVTKGFPLAYFGVIGYRYQKKNGGLFRIGCTPCVYPEVTLPFLGISFGYSL